jgi:energy-coupling factor transporter ATP-binding protein EcfA2
MKFSEYGATYYFNQSGKGFYLGLGISQLNVKANYKDISLDMGRSGSGKTEIDLNTTNLKLGVKTGGRVYFRIELGYGIGNLPQSVTFVATDNSNPSYTETTTEEIPSIPGVSENGMIIGNIGLGVSF